MFNIVLVFVHYQVIVRNFEFLLECLMFNIVLIFTHYLCINMINNAESYALSYSYV